MCDLEFLRNICFHSEAGEIPVDIGDLTQLSSLDLHGNKLSGECWHDD